LLIIGLKGSHGARSIGQERLIKRKAGRALSGVGIDY
jgi:hypothetical protein